MYATYQYCASQLHQRPTTSLRKEKTKNERNLHKKKQKTLAQFKLTKDSKKHKKGAVFKNAFI